MKENTVSMVRFTPINLRSNYDDTFASLVWAVRMGYPRVTVFLDNDKFGAKTDYSKQIKATFDQLRLNVFLTSFGKIIDGENDKEIGVKCYNNVYSQGVRTDNIELQATVFAGKDKDGVIYMKVVESGKREVKFELMMSGKYIKLVKPDGQDLEDKAKLSKMYATEYLRALRLLLDDEFKKQVKSVNVKAAGGAPQQKAPSAPTVGIDSGDDLILDDM